MESGPPAQLAHTDETIMSRLIMAPFPKSAPRAGFNGAAGAQPRRDLGSFSKPTVLCSLSHPYAPEVPPAANRQGKALRHMQVGQSEPFAQGENVKD